jgi:hypothetical protein
MKQKKPVLPISILTLILASLACTIFVGGPDYSDRAPVPVSKDAADGLREDVKRSFEEGLTSGVVTIRITESQITSVLALRLQSDQNLQENKQPIITDPQVYLRDGQMLIYGRTRQGFFTANIGIVVSVGAGENFKPKIEVTSADFGPFPVPDGLKDAISAMIEEAYTGSLGPVATGLRVESITIVDGVMTILGRIR